MWWRRLSRTKDYVVTGLDAFDVVMDIRLVCLTLTTGQDFFAAVELYTFVINYVFQTRLALESLRLLYVFPTRPRSLLDTMYYVLACCIISILMIFFVLIPLNLPLLVLLSIVFVTLGCFSSFFLCESIGDCVLGVFSFCSGALLDRIKATVVSVLTIVFPWKPFYGLLSMGHLNQWLHITPREGSKLRDDCKFFDSFLRDLPVILIQISLFSHNQHLSWFAVLRCITAFISIASQLTKLVAKSFPLSDKDSKKALCCSIIGNFLLMAHLKTRLKTVSDLISSPLLPGEGLILWIIYTILLLFPSLISAVFLLRTGARRSLELLFVGCNVFSYSGYLVDFTRRSVYIRSLYLMRYLIITGGLGLMTFGVSDLDFILFVGSLSFFAVTLVISLGSDLFLFFKRRHSLTSADSTRLSYSLLDHADSKQSTEVDLSYNLFSRSSLKRFWEGRQDAQTSSLVLRASTLVPESIFEALTPDTSFSLRHLDLSCLNLARKNVLKDLNEFLPRCINLQVLKVARCGLEYAGIEAVLSTIASKCTALRELDLHGNEILLGFDSTDCCCHDEGSRQSRLDDLAEVFFVNLLSCSEALAILDLRDCGIRHPKYGLAFQRALSYVYASGRFFDDVRLQGNFGIPFEFRQIQIISGRSSSLGKSRGSDSSRPSVIGFLDVAKTFFEVGSRE